MNKKRVAQIRELATQYFRDLEARLLDLNVVFREVCSEMQSSTLQYRKTLKRTSLVPYLKHRPGKDTPSEVHWVTTCRSRPTLESRPAGPAKGRRRWVKYLPGGLTRDRVAQLAKDIANLPTFRRYDERFLLLNDARRTIVRARMGFEHTLRGLAVSRGWETESPAYAAPLVSPDLPATSKRALAHAWSLCLRLASADLELRAIAERHNVKPAYRGLRLRFERDAAHPYGRSLWTLFGERLLSHARHLAKDAGRIEDAANLTERVMRTLRIPARARAAIRPHEAARRRLESCRRSYVALFKHLKKLSGEAVASAATHGKKRRLRSRAG